MSSRSSRAEHEAALARRLQLLGEELHGVRDGPWAVPDTHTRVHVEPAPTTVPVPVPAPVVPVPGRHASRRSGRLAALVPETLRGRVGLGAGPLAVVAVLVALGLAVTTWWVVRADTTTVAPLAPVVPQPATDLATPGPPPAEASPAVAESVTVDVAGKVRRPGIAVLDAGDRVVDALRAAGGARPGVDLADLNLARVLVDGEQIVVGEAAAVGPPPGLPSDAATAPGAPTGTLVDLNTADMVALESLPEVGPVTAQAILTWRDANGGFTSVSELLEVDGIGDATLAAMAPFVTV
ncbi:MAG: helix-hairpin-helix domain-containing protein [Nocardioides sp.]